MKPVLFIVTGDWYRYTDLCRLRAQRWLARWGIPMRTEWHGDIASLDPDDYSGIMTLSFSAWGSVPNIIPWVTGEKGIPSMSWLLNAVNDGGAGVTTGATARSAAKTDTYQVYTDADGNRLYQTKNDYYGGPSNYTYTLDAADANVEVLLTDPADETYPAACWRRRNPTTGVWCGFTGIHSFTSAMVLTWLRNLDIAPVNPIPLQIEIDEAEGKDSTHVEQGPGIASGIQQFAEWLRARNAVAMIGLSAGFGEYWPEVKAAIQDNSDVYACFLHDHAYNIFFPNGNYYTECTGYETVEKKVAKVYECTAQLQAWGFQIADNGGAFGAHAPMPGNGITYMGFKALAKLGLRTMRSAGLLNVNYHRVPVVTELDGEPYTVQCYNCFGPVNNGFGGSIAKWRTDMGASSEAQYGAFIHSQDKYWSAMASLAGYSHSPIMADAVLLHTPDMDITYPEHVKWQPSTAYPEGTIIVPTACSTGWSYIAVFGGGTSGETEPTWPMTGSVVDGSVEWERYYPAGDGAAQDFLKYWDYLIGYSDGWIRWATADDIARMPEKVRRAS